MTRRPKNHDRLIQARKNQNRHSAPAGSLEDDKTLPSRKLSCDTNDSSVGKTPVPSVIKRSTSDKFRLDKRGLLEMMNVPCISLKYPAQSVEIDWVEVSLSLINQQSIRKFSSKHSS